MTTPTPTTPAPTTPAPTTAESLNKTLVEYLGTLTCQLTEAQKAQFIAVAQAFGLNPFKREIYATAYKTKDGTTQMSIVTGYEVYLKRAEMNQNYDGFDTEFGCVDKQLNCTCRVYRKDRRMPISSTVWMSEYNSGRSLWASKPRFMLEKVAIATAFRRAFPVDFGGMPYTTDEMPEHMTKVPEVQEVQEVQEEPSLAHKAHRLADFREWVNAQIAIKGEAAVLGAIQAAGYENVDAVPYEALRGVVNSLNTAEGGQNG